MAIFDPHAQAVAAETKGTERSASGPPMPRRSLVRTGTRKRTALVIAGTGVVAGGLVLGWSWLTALGVAPVILALAPCLVMCAVGGCAMALCRSGPAHSAKGDSDESPGSPTSYGIGGLMTQLMTWRVGVIAGGIAIAGGGLALGWGWLVAVGAAPVLLSLLPCAAMCALGICMMPKSDSSRAKRTYADESSEGI